MKRIAINGFGRIGRLVFRILDRDKDIEIVAINDLSTPEDLAYLLKYDTSHRTYKKNEIAYDNENIIIDGKKIKILACKDPNELPWDELEIDLVFECTGLFTSYDKAYAHINAGAKKVIISAPAKGDIKTIVYNVNHKILDGSEKIISAASCTTNCLAPVAKIVNDNFGIKKGFMTTVHAITNDQATLDVAHKKGIYSRRGRAASFNIVPTSTGAAKALGLVIPELKGKLDGIALRVPTSTGSVVDLNMVLEKNVSVDDINNIIKNNINETIDFTMEPIVSSDVIGESHSSIVDGLLTQILDTEDGQMVKIIAWYDNEMGYTYQMVRTAKYFLSL